MISLKDLREQFGISQESAAEFLAMSRSHYSMIEGGKRKLTGSGYYWVEQVREALNSAEQNMQRHAVTAINRSECERHANECLYQAQRERRKLRQLEERNDHCIKSMQVLQHLKANITYRPMLQWLDHMEAKVHSLMYACSELEQAKLKASIHAWEQEADHICKNF